MPIFASYYIEILWHSPASSKRNSVRQNRCCDIYVIIILCTAQEGAVERLVTHLNAPRRVDVDKEFQKNTHEVSLKTSTHVFSPSHFI